MYAIYNNVCITNVQAELNSLVMLKIEPKKVFIISLQN